MRPEPVEPDGGHGALFLTELRKAFAQQKAQAERVFAQLEPSDWHATLGGESNSVAVLARHLAGNLRSRYADFLTSDGEKPDRDRDGEFTPTSMSPAEILEEWDAGWETLLATTAELTPADLGATVTIRGQERLALEALLATLDHNAQHVGQIVMLGKNQRGARWDYLTIPPAHRQR